MKKNFFLEAMSIVFLILTSFDVQGQLEVSRYKKSRILISYCNENDMKEVSYFLPVSFFVPIKRNKIIIRSDRQKKNNDTLEVFLNDTTIQSAFGGYNFYDSLSKLNKMYRYDNLQPKECNKFVITLDEKAFPKYLKVFYNWGYSAEESRRLSILLIKI